MQRRSEHRSYNGKKGAGSNLVANLRVVEVRIFALEPTALVQLLEALLSALLGLLGVGGVGDGGLC